MLLLQLTKDILIKIANFLSLNELLKFSMTCSNINQICNSNEIWKNQFECYFSFYSTFTEYKRNLDSGTLKDLCYQIYLRYPNLHNLLSIEQIERVFDYHDYAIVEMSDDSSSGSCVSTLEPTKKLRHSIARMNLNQYVKESFGKETSRDCYELTPTDSSGNESEKIEEIKSFRLINRSISNSSIISSFSNKTVQNSSKTNLLLAPCSSAASITDKNICDYFHNTELVLKRKQKMLLMKDEHDLKTLGFTRTQMKERLRNLVKVALTNDSKHKDNSLPGNKTTRFALEYRK